MDKIIFLDIDGVISTLRSITDDGGWGLTVDCQDRLGVIIAATKAQIVLTSSWRLSTVSDTRGYMASCGFRFCDDIIGVTIRGYHYIQKGFPMSIPRGVEIKQWIDNNIHRNNGTGEFKRKKLGVDYNYVILDDDSDMLYEHRNRFIHCDSLIGLTDDEVIKAIEILNS